MTCIVGVVHSNQIVLGGDSSAVSGWTANSTAQPKVFRRGPFLVGYTTSFRMGNVLEHVFDPPKQEGDDVMRYMVADFIESCRHTFREAGIMKSDNGREEGGSFLVGYRGRLFEVSDDFLVLEPASGYTAVGCGRDTALGSLHTSRGRPAKARVLAALQASAAHSIAVSAPFHLRTMTGRE